MMSPPLRRPQAGDDEPRLRRCGDLVVAVYVFSMTDVLLIFLTGEESYGKRIRKKYNANGKTEGVFSGSEVVFVG